MQKKWCIHGERWININAAGCAWRRATRGSFCPLCFSRLDIYLFVIMHYFHGQTLYRMHSDTCLSLLFLENSCAIHLLKNYLRPTQQERIVAYYCKLSQLPMVGEVIGLPGEPNFTTFLNQYDFQLYLKYLIFAQR